MMHLNTLITFFNANIQGIDVIYRAFKGDMPASQRIKVKRKLYSRLIMMAAMTLSYAQMMEDEDLYKDATPAQRLSNWFIPIGGTALRIPIPFEVGFIGKALPEGVYNMAFSDRDASKTLKELYDMFLRSMPLVNPGAGLIPVPDLPTAQEMLINILFAILLIYMLIAALFESLLFPLAVLVSIVFSAVGVFWFLFLTGTTFTAMASTGMLLLTGIVVNNGIVLLSRIIQLRNEGLSRADAILSSGRHRLRPILMTVCTTVAGLLPLAVGDVRVGGLGPSYFPMARTIIGGLVFSTLITLVLLPVIYVLLDDLKMATNRRWSATRGWMRRI